MAPPNLTMQPNPSETSAQHLLEHAAGLKALAENCQQQWQKILEDAKQYRGAQQVASAREQLAWINGYLRALEEVLQADPQGQPITNLPVSDIEPFGVSAGPLSAPEPQTPGSINTLVRRWWMVEYADEYNIGGEHTSYDSAEYYRTKCVDKMRSKRCKVVHYELYKITNADSPTEHT